MECTHTRTNKEEFNQKITIFNSRYDLYFFSNEYAFIDSK